MRIAYKNIVDDASAITAYSELSSYPVENVQDQRLSTRWISDSTTSQNIVLTFPTFPEYPDNPSGTTYFQGAWATIDSWSLSNAVAGAPTVSGGVLTADMTRSGGSASILARNVSFAASSYKTWKVKIRGTINAIRPKYNNGTEYGITGTSIPVTPSWAIVDIPIAGDANWTGTINRIQFNCDSDGTFEIDWIYVGDGTYSTQLTDLSGNGNHGTVYGATPKADGSLSFNGVNDYVQTSPVPNITESGYSISFWAKAPTGQGDYKPIIAGGDGTYASWTVLTFQEKFYLQLKNNSNASQDYATYAMAFEQNTFNHYMFVVTGSGGNWSVSSYKNGVLVGTQIRTFTMNSVTPFVRMGLNVNGSVYFNNTIRSPRIYNRALSEQEITSLYSEKPFASEYLGLVGDWTLDKPYKVNTAAVLGHNIKSGTVVSVQANNSDEWSDPPFSTTFSYIASDATILKYLSSTYNYKYWRFTFSGQGDIEVGRLWLGEYLQINPASSLDFSVIKKTDDTVVYGKGRQKYASIGNKWRRIELRFPRSDANMVTAIERMYDEVGRHSSFIFTNFDSLREYPLVEPLYGSFTDDVQFSHTNRMKYTYDLAIEEDL